MDATGGVLTTYKLQSLLDCGLNGNVRSRRDLVAVVSRGSARITIHGVEAWFRHVDSNLPVLRDSLSDAHRSYAVPRRRWPALLEVFDIHMSHLDLTDEEFRRWCFTVSQPGDAQATDVLHLVGRDLELRELMAAYDRSKGELEGPSLVLVEGAPGVGKSSLLNAATREFRRQRALVLPCSCVEHADTSLLPILDMVDTHRDAMRRENEAAVATLDLLLGTAEPMDLGDGLLVRLKRAFLTLAERQALVLVVDDAHWADDSTMRFLMQFARGQALERQRALVLLAARPDADDAEWTDGLRSAARRAIVLRLTALDRSQSAALVRNHLSEPCSEAFLHWIWDRTRGNPFYMEQMLDHLRRSGQLDPTREPPIETDVPQSIAMAIAARLKRLSEATRQLLPLASVFGTTFRTAELQYAYGQLTTGEVIDCLEEAEIAGLIAYESDRFQFSHPLTRQTIYESLTDGRRAYWHFIISQRLIERNETSPLVSLAVANHMLRGRMFADGDILANACVEASRVSLRLEAWDEVVRFAEAALDVDERHRLAEDVRREMERLAGHGLHQAGNPRGAISYLQRVVDAHQRAGNVTEASRALIEVCRIRSNYGIASNSQSDDVETLLEALPVLREADSRLAAWTIGTIAFQFYSAKDMDRAAQYNDEALALLEIAGPSREHSLVLIGAGLLRLVRAEPVSACQYFLRGEAMARAVGDKGTISRSLQRLVLAQLALGRLDDLRTTTESMRLLEDDPAETGEHTLVLATELTACSLRAEHQAVRRTYAEAQCLLNRTGYVGAIDRLHGACAASLATAGEYDAARDVIATLADWQSRTTGVLGRGPLNASPRQLSFLVDVLEQPSVAGDIPQDLQIRKPRDMRYMVDVPTFAIGLEIAIQRGHLQQIRVAMAVIEEAFRRGTAVATVWPSVCALQLARAAFALGDIATAKGYLPVAYDVVRRMNSTRLLNDTTTLAQRVGFNSLPGEA